MIWSYVSMVRQGLDDDYYFYEDGTIIHHYDRTIQKTDIEECILPSEISDYTKGKILSKCKKECCQDVINQIQNILG